MINKLSSDLLKWVSSISVLIGHILLYSNNKSISEIAFVPPFDYFIGTICVGVFLFLSGYGLSFSLLNKYNYLQSFGRRVRSILYPFLVIVILYHIVTFVITYLGLSTGVRNEITMSFSDRILPFSWYIFLQVMLYMIFYVSFRYIDNKNYSYGLVILSFLCVFLMVLMRILNFPSYSIVSIPSFLFGSCWGGIRNKNSFLMRLFISLMFIILIINIMLRIDIPLINYTLISFGVVWIFSRLSNIPQIISKFILKIDSYFIYLVQGFWIILPKYENLYIYILCSLSGTIISAFVINRIYKNFYIK